MGTLDAFKQIHLFTYNTLFVLEKMGHPRHLFLFSVFLKQTTQVLEQLNVKNIHPVYGTGIRTHNLLIMRNHPVTTRPGLLP